MVSFLIDLNLDFPRFEAKRGGNKPCALNMFIQSRSFSNAFIVKCSTADYTQPEKYLVEWSISGNFYPEEIRMTNYALINALVHFSQDSGLSIGHPQPPIPHHSLCLQTGAWLRVSGMRPFPGIPSPLEIHPDGPIRAFLWMHPSLLT